MRFWTLYLILTFSSLSQAQNFSLDLSSWDKALIHLAKASSFSIFETKQEQDVIFYCNLARLDGCQFVKTILLPYLQAQNDTNLNDFYISSLIAVLNRLPRLKPLRNSKLLTIMARDYATKSGNAGIVGHSNFDQRFAALFHSGWTVGENCTYRQSGALNIVMELLVDEGVPSMGHRKNILSPAFTRVGVGSAKHRDFDNVWVLEFIGK